jgi:hypothetical protein
MSLKLTLDREFDVDTQARNPMPAASAAPPMTRLVAGESLRFLAP